MLLCVVIDIMIPKSDELNYPHVILYLLGRNQSAAMTEAALVCLHWMHARSHDGGHASYRGWLPWHDTGPVFATGMLFVLLPLTHDALCSAPLPTFGFWLGPFCFHTANEPHQGSLGNEWRPPISSRPEFTCLVHTRVWTSFHTIQNIPEKHKSSSSC